MARRRLYYSPFPWREVMMDSLAEWKANQMPRKRRRFSAVFKAKVAMSSSPGNATGGAGNRSMVDRKARDRLAEIGRQLTTGQLPTGRFESLLPFPTSDPAVEEIWSNLFDYLYNDIWPFWSHRLTGKRKPKRDTRAIVARAIVFLHSDIEFDRESLGDKYDPELWPFVSDADLDSAKKRSRLLRGVQAG
ncbi:MAG: hypothetical protein KAS72_01950 [Phycisphaerales bacterium]|nr:hypothetical protein [Phycisphaerales bacterium]